MKNYEKYADEIKEYKGRSICSEFIKPHILEADNCDWVDCRRCSMLQTIWLMEEYEEPETDWSKVPVDTPILVSDVYEEEWYKRHFAKYEDGHVYAWFDGQTSWTGAGEIKWKYAKLAEMEGAE